MTDLEMIKKCSERMGFECVESDGFIIVGRTTYNPLHDDAQAMALVKKFKLRIFDTMIPPLTSGWIVCAPRNVLVSG